MNEREIDDIRDAANFLRRRNPKMAFKLFSVALSHRPNGSLIRKNYQELKEKLNLKTFVIIGNCQATVVANFIQERAESLVARQVISAHLYKNHDDSLYKSLDEVDFIITQNVDDKFEGINTKEILSRYGNKTVRYLNLFYEGYHPDWCYFPVLNGVRLKSPVGDYHNRTVIETFIEGGSERQAIERYFDIEFNRQSYFSVGERSIAELRNREQEVDIKMTDVIEQGVQDGEMLFHTFNHPSSKLLNIQVGRILEHLKIKYNRRFVNREVLNNLVMRANPMLGLNQKYGKTTHLQQEVDIPNFVHQCYSIYASRPKFIEAYKTKYLNSKKVK
ncbi:hypothetical protein G3R49_02360 [Shewanella sp. WXL01]|uniref:Polysaccharide biosynthesis enzyme WcbI domain-containing protein n=1 Tax=Shewanella maritima TaxID=2520507 RepID=A0A411PG54_9GAMM|nr:MULTISPECIES: WcbI family polysaccharide biosynthesis putative acetyltransferase [Shewanella]NKF49424.1 hypothetical protein [Shewanella sp. WXL01]QBF82468.1 hypothetical protein EXU30_06970 [Shewanella maritima]